MRVKKDGRAFSTVINELLWKAIKDEQPKPVIQNAVESSGRVHSTDKFLTMESLRNRLRSCKKVSPMKTELVAILSAILKDEPEQSAAGIVSAPVEEDDSELDDFLERRKQKQIANEEIKLANTDVFRPNGALERAIERGGPDAKEQLKKYVQAANEPKRTISEDLDDWHPDDE